MSPARKPLDVWIFQTGEYLPVIHPDKRPMRAGNVSKALLDAGHRVTLWTADWIHQESRHAYGKHTNLDAGGNLDIRLVHSPGYRRNIGPGRLYDHAVLARQLRLLLDDMPPPDVAFVGFPPIEASHVMVQWLLKREVPVLLDVKDQWPDVFLRALPERLHPLGRRVLGPYFAMARSSMEQATGLSAMAQEFLDWALKSAGRPQSETDLVVPLTTARRELTEAELSAASAWWDSLGVVDDGRLRGAYVGTIGTHLELDDIERAAADTQFELVLCGSGSAFDEVSERFAGHPGVVLPGYVNQAQAQVLAARSTVGLAPYIVEEGFDASVPNKIYDYMGAGLPLVSSVGGATQRLLEREGIGIAYGPGLGMDLASALKLLEDQPQRLSEMGARCAALYASTFSFERVYGNLVHHLEKMADSGLIAHGS